MSITLVNVVTVSLCIALIGWCWRRPRPRLNVTEDLLDEEPEPAGCCLYALFCGGVAGGKRVCGGMYTLFKLLSCLIGAPLVCVTVFAVMARWTGALDEQIAKHREL